MQVGVPQVRGEDGEARVHGAVGQDQVGEDPVVPGGFGAVESGPAHAVEFALHGPELVMFDQGTVLEDGPPEQLMTDPAHERTRLFLRRIHNSG
ncbi:hypothetical protein IQ63_28570 [Streptomyces acidiscabies]|uniref:Glutamine transport ATP-binding protein GlnQ n=1 Tax=Streptomyces acidiscabies TaxID=42234 RepID=A0A0L0JXU7_9ACTN|nr:hypothetical protein IQ63_28570 [Streptomyces acidiscabies]